MTQDRRLRRAGGLQPLRGRLGARDGHALPVDQAGRVALGRHAQRHDRPLAERHQGARARSASQFHHVIDVAPTDPRGRGASAADRRERRPAGADRRASACCTRSTTRRPPERHETQYFEMFCNRGIYHKGWTAVTRHGVPWVGACTSAAFDDDVGSSTTPTPTGRQVARPRQGEHPKKLARAAAAVPDRGGASTTCCRSTTGRSSASTRTSPVARSSSRGNSPRSCSAAWRRLTEKPLVVTHQQCRYAIDRGSSTSRKSGANERHRRARRQRRAGARMPRARKFELLLQLPSAFAS